MQAGSPHLRLVGGTGPSYPSFTVEADSARTADSRWRGCWPCTPARTAGRPLWKSGSRGCAVPPYNRRHYRDRLISGLRTLGIPRLDRETDLSGLRPEIPVIELTADRLNRLLAIIDH
jgi:hypothetical protein